MLVVCVQCVHSLVACAIFSGLVKVPESGKAIIRITIKLWLFI